MAKYVKNKQMETLDIESQGYTVDEAMKLLKEFIIDMKKEKKTIVKVIHGYGSTGVGGAIKKQVEGSLRSLQRQKQIVGFIPGNAYYVTGYIEIRDKYDRYLKADEAHKHDNEGITYIALREPS